MKNYIISFVLLICLVFTFILICEITPRSVTYNVDTISRVQMNKNYNGHTSYWVFPKEEFPKEITRMQYIIISNQLIAK